MKPRTAEELAAWNAQGVDLETCDRLGLSPERIANYRKAYPKEHKINTTLYRAWRKSESDGPWPGELSTDGRLIHNPNPAEKRFFND